MDPVLSVINVNKNFDGTVALDDFSLDVPKNTITGIIGPNGAGKTTLFNVVTGFLPADSGRVIYNGKHLNSLKPYLISRLGMARTFQQLRLITKLSVMDNIMVSFPNQSGERVREIFFFPGRIKEQEKRTMKKRSAISDTWVLKTRHMLLLKTCLMDSKKWSLWPVVWLQVLTYFYWMSPWQGSTPRLLTRSWQLSRNFPKRERQLS